MTMDIFDKGQDNGQVFNITLHYINTTGVLS